MPVFHLERTVSAERDAVYNMLSNYAHYKILLPQHFPSIRVRSSRGDVSVVEEHMNLGGRELISMARHVTREPILHEVFVIGGDAKGSHIRQQFLDTSHGTKVTVDADIKLGLPGLFGRNTVKHDYARILDDFLDAVERLD